MTANRCEIVDPQGHVLATVQVEPESDCWGGIISCDCMLESVRQLFAEFAEIVNGQMFSFLDDIQDKIDLLSLTAVFENGSEAPVQDLQIYPSTGDVSFKLATVAS